MLDQIIKFEIRLQGYRDYKFEFVAKTQFL